MLLHATEGETPAVMFADDLRGTDAELMAAGIGGHATDVAADELHGVTAIARPGTMVARGLRRAAVDNGNEVICDDQAVFAFLRGTFRDDALLENLHIWDSLAADQGCCIVS